MVNARRKNLLRMADSAANAQERSAKHLVKLTDVYQEDHPDLALQVSRLGVQALQLRKLILRFRHERM